MKIRLSPELWEVATDQSHPSPSAILLPRGQTTLLASGLTSVYEVTIAVYVHANINLLRLKNLPAMVN